jgi:hypothetical protein
MEVIRERGTPLDKSRSGHDLVTRAETLQTLPFVQGGVVYRVPEVQFRPWYDLVSILTNKEENVIGNIISMPRNEGKLTAAATLQHEGHKHANSVLCRSSSIETRVSFSKQDQRAFR